MDCLSGANLQHTPLPSGVFVIPVTVRAYFQFKCTLFLELSRKKRKREIYSPMVKKERTLRDI